MVLSDFAVVKAEIFSEKVLEYGFLYSETADGLRHLITVIPPCGADTELLAVLRDREDVAYVRYAKPVLPVVKKQGAVPPFFSAEEALAFQQESGAAP